MEPQRRPPVYGIRVLIVSAVRLVAVCLSGYGGRILRPADAPPHGGMRGYVADPDDHAWEIAWNPAWPISREGYVRFAPP